MRDRRSYLIAVAVLIVLRFAAGMVLPLSADEAYYWLWSRHLAAGYYDHPPMIAFLIRAGVMIFGDTSFGVRVAPLLLSVAASWFVWRAGALILRDERAAALSCLLFNLTLMTAVETMAATPDAPLIVCSAAFLWTLAKVDETGDGRWWLAAGIAGGLALLSKYTAFFLGAGALAWVVFVPSARRWLISPWPYLGAILAVAVFAPNLWWNATHHWMTFLFQFGRVGTGHFTLRFLFEFVGAQLLLATPFIFVCGIFGLFRKETALLTALILPSIVYFAIHSLHDRVQGNWPCFLYPAFAVAAAGAIQFWNGRFAKAERVSAWLAVPAASILLVLCYVQAFFGVLPLGRSDPFARLLAFGLPNVVQKFGTLAPRPTAILTTDYETTAWFSFYSSFPVVQLNEEQRWLTVPRASAKHLTGPLLYVAPRGKDRPELLASGFRNRWRIGSQARMRHDRAVEEFVLYEVRGLKSQPLGREP